jgi:hypothetical protein
MKHIILEFEAPDDWEPLSPVCWVDCPFAVLTPLGNECRARKSHRKYDIMICPVIRYGGILGKYEERSENDLQRSSQIHSS